MYRIVFSGLLSAQNQVTLSGLRDCLVTVQVVSAERDEDKKKSGM